MRHFVAPALLAVGVLAAGAHFARVAQQHGFLPRARTAAPRSPREALLRRELQGLHGLLARAERGPLVPLDGGQAVVIVDQALVKSLLGALLPFERVVAGRYRVRVEHATAAFEDGFALVRLDGRASLLGAESEVFADLSVYGDLEVPRRQPAPEVLQARVNVVAVEARRVDVLVEARQAEALVAELGRTRLEEFARLLSPVEIPVRQDHTFSMPSLGRGGPVQIEAASVPFRLTVQDVAAFHGKLFISMAAGGPEQAVDVAPPADRRSAADPALGLVDVGQLEREHRSRHERLESLVARDPFLREALRIPGDLALAMRADFARQVIREVARLYLQQVNLQLGDIDVQRSGTLTRETVLGRVRAGEWSMGVRIHELKGVLRAGEPEVGFLDGNRVGLTFPLQLERGEGRASVNFRWDARGIANIVCRDFEASPEIQGTVVPEEYPVRGSFALAASASALTARPAFRDEFRVRLALSPESWGAVRATLEEQDGFFRCGIVLDPTKVMGRLRQLVSAGFDVKVPDRIFRTIELPGHVAESVVVGDREVGVRVNQNALRVSRSLLWYSASVGVGPPASRPTRAAVEPTVHPAERLALLHADHAAPACGAARPGPPRVQPSGS